MKRFTETNLPFIILIIAILLAFYTWSITEFFTRPPSVGMSRSLTIAETALAPSGLDRTHLLTIPSPDGETATLVAVDGENTRILTIDKLGNLIGETSLELDLSQAKHVGGSQQDNGLLTIFMDRDSLERLDINLEKGTWTREIITTDFISFKTSASILIFERKDGLYGYNTNGFRSIKPVVSGSIIRYEIDFNNEVVTIVSVIEKPADLFDITMIRCNPSFDAPHKLVLMDNSSDEMYRKLQDISVYENLVSILSVWRDNRYGLNYITIQLMHRVTGKVTGLFQTHVPIQNSRYILIEENSDAVSFLMPRQTVFGYNLVQGTLHRDSDVEYSDLTKTRPLSILSAFFDMNGWDTMVFSDYIDDRRIIQFASNHPELMSSNTRLSGSDIITVSGAVLTNMVIALFLGSLYLLLISIVPFGIVIILTKRNANKQYWNYISCAIGLAIYTWFKLSVAHSTINKTANYSFPAPVVGSEPIIYVTLIIMSFLSYALVARFLNNSKNPGHTVTGSFFQFLLIDSIQFTFIFIIYGVTSLLMGEF